MQITLTKPITTHQGSVGSITLKEPTAKSFILYGDPFKIAVQADMQIDVTWANGPMAKFLTEMTGLNEIEIEQLDAGDYLKLRNAAFNIITGFGGSKDPLA